MVKTVVVGMSGGVDSSVSALLLQRQGYQVIGLFMKNWEENDPSGRCLATRDFEDVARVCEKLKVPYYSVNFVEEYRESVFLQFLADIEAGLTPNPDVLCNREIKFKVFLAKAKELGADCLATGHYCQTEGGRLFKGADPQKDQSYFLHAVAGEAFRSVLFPVGALEKSEVRRLAREYGLATAEKKESTGICFIGKRDFKPFVAQYIAKKPGLFKTLSGETVGEHDGAVFYTLGQRKGMGLGGEGDAWYVVGKDVAQNVVFVERGESHPALFSSSLQCDSLTWVQGAPPEFPFRCTAKIRYRQDDQPCVVAQLGERAEVRFDAPQRAVTPGQSVVFYQNNECLGGGIIRPDNKGRT